MAKPFTNDSAAPGQQRRAWMVAAQAGDAEAYQALLEDAGRLLDAFFRSRLRDPQDRRDGVQDTLMLIHRARHSYDPARPFEPWLFAIAHHALVDHVRRRQRQIAREVLVEDLPEVVADPAPDPDTIRRLNEALRALPPAQHEAFRLLKIDGLPVQAAARRAGVASGTLRVRAHRAYKALRAALGGSA
jgi:RNA polymerase sigma-70 factor, ECF subfamily